MRDRPRHHLKAVLRKAHTGHARRIRHGGVPQDRAAATAGPADPESTWGIRTAKIGDLIDQIDLQLRMNLGGVKPIDYAIALRGERFEVRRR